MATWRETSRVVQGALQATELLERVRGRTPWQGARPAGAGLHLPALVELARVAMLATLPGELEDEAARAIQRATSVLAVDVLELSLDRTRLLRRGAGRQPLEVPVDLASEGSFARALLTGELVILDPRQLTGSLLLPETQSAGELRRGVLAAIPGPTRALGVLAAYGRAAAFDEPTLQLIRGVAQLVGDALTRQRELAVRAERERALEQLADAAHDYAQFMLDPTGRISSWSRGAERLTGWPLAEILGQPLSTLFGSGETSRRRADRVLRGAQAEGSAEDVGFRVRRDGSQFWSSLSLSLRQEPGRGATGNVAILQDLTTHREAEQVRGRLLEQVENESRLAAVLTHIPAGVMIAEAPSGRMLLWNDAAEQILGLTPDRLGLLGDPSGPLRAFHLDGRPYLHAELPLTRALAGESVGDQELRFLRPDGSRGTMIANATAVRDGEGRAQWAVLTFVDVTRLRQTEDALRAAVSARDDILAIVSHDLRNPLNAVGLSAKVLLRALESGREPVDGRPLRTIVSSVQRMDRLIQDLLDVTRLDAGRFAIEPRNTSIEAVFDETVETSGPIASHKGIDLRAEVQPPLPQIHADRERLLQLLSNLVSNAIKFTPAGGSITLRARLLGDEELEVSVEDTGPGIPKEQQLQLFDRFWQADKTDRRGVGLGLFIAKAIVDGHGGRFWVESEVGRGTRFVFTLRLSPQEEAGSARPTA